MRSAQERKIAEGAAPHLDPGEEILAAIVAAPRGHTQTVAGSMHLGAAQQGRAHGAAGEAGISLEAPMALAVTQRRLLTLRIGTPIGLGIGGKVKDLMSAVPLSEVDSIEVRRLLLGKKITLTVRGVPIALEANAAANAAGLAEAFAAAKAGPVRAA
jgi:hypothetical protein